MCLAISNEKDDPMNCKFIFAACAVAFIATVGTTDAWAHDSVNFSLNFGGGYPGYYPEPYPDYPSYPAPYDSYESYDDSSCGYEYITVKRWNRYHDHYRIVHRRVWVCN